MINIVAFNLEHLQSFDPKSDFEDLERDMSRNILNNSMLILSLIWEEKTLAIVGVTQFRTGVGELWLLPSVNVDKVKFTFFKKIKNLINYVFNSLNFHRLEIAIDNEWEHGKKWARKLGFNFGHICEAYDTNYRDHAIYYKVMRWQKAR